ncbi:MAG: hypothetical protein FD128_106 [Hyphomonadaceae bacterium]|nr:MAG: hypothetical protein FD128_106 [Hyphomonadaceae bacterium]
MLQPILALILWTFVISAIDVLCFGSIDSNGWVCRWIICQTWLDLCGAAGYSLTYPSNSRQSYSSVFGVCFVTSCFDCDGDPPNSASIYLISI